jgi:hypothetical protein
VRRWTTSSSSSSIQVSSASTVECASVADPGSCVFLTHGGSGLGKNRLPFR